MKQQAENDRRNGANDVRASPPPEAGQGDGDERSDDVAQAAADIVDAERPAADLGFDRRRDQRRRRRVVAAPENPHQGQEDGHAPVMRGQADHQAGQGDARDAHGDQQARPEAIGEPPRGKLGEAVGNGERGDEHAGGGVIELKVGSDIGQQRRREKRHHVMAEVPQHKQRDRARKY